MSTPQAKKGPETSTLIQPPAQCNANDFACLSMQYHELYKYAVGLEGCIDPPACTKKGKRPAEVLSLIFKACNEEAAGDFDKYAACIMDIAGLMEKVGQKLSIFKR